MSSPIKWPVPTTGCFVIQCAQTDLILIEKIEKAIYLIRGEKVMLDRNLASLYGVETGALNRALKRNLQRFPPDFMFQLTTDESDFLRCQIGISKRGRGGRRFLPYVCLKVSTINSFRVVFDAIRQLMSAPTQVRKEIGFRSRSVKK